MKLSQASCDYTLRLLSDFLNLKRSSHVPTTNPRGYNSDSLGHEMSHFQLRDQHQAELHTIERSESRRVEEPAALGWRIQGQPISISCAKMPRIPATGVDPRAGQRSPTESSPGNEFSHCRRMVLSQRSRRFHVASPEASPARRSHFLSLMQVKSCCQTRPSLMSAVGQVPPNRFRQATQPEHFSIFVAAGCDCRPHLQTCRFR